MAILRWGNQACLLPMATMKKLVIDLAKKVIGFVVSMLTGPKELPSGNHFAEVPRVGIHKIHTPTPLSTKKCNTLFSPQTLKANALFTKYLCKHFVNPFLPFFFVRPCALAPLCENLYFFTSATLYR